MLILSPETQFRAARKLATREEKMTSNSKTDDDVKNIEAWAVVVRHLLYRMPVDGRAEVLALAVKNEEAERKKWEASGGCLSAAKLRDKNSPYLDHWHTIMRLRRAAREPGSLLN